MLEIRSLNARIGHKHILQNVSLKLTPHTITAVIGKNGCGKSTLVSCINQTQRYTGEILYSGRSIALMRPRERAGLISILPQALNAPAISVKELVQLGRSPYVDIGRHLTPADHEAIARAMEITGMQEFAHRRVDELSGGERQRAYLAMSLAQDTRLMIFDEPTTYMDMACEGEFMRSLDMLKTRHKKTLLVIMHNLNQAVRHADRIAIMQDGAIIHDGPTAECIACGIIEETFGVKKIIAPDGVFFTA